MHTLSLISSYFYVNILDKKCIPKSNANEISALFLFRCVNKMQIEITLNKEKKKEIKRKIKSNPIKRLF